jgi:hypothetical protein
METFAASCPGMGEGQRHIMTHYRLCQRVVDSRERLSAKQNAARGVQVR